MGGKKGNGRAYQLSDDVVSGRNELQNHKEDFIQSSLLDLYESFCSIFLSQDKSKIPWFSQAPINESVYFITLLTGKRICDLISAFFKDISWGFHHSGDDECLYYYTLRNRTGGVN